MQFFGDVHETPPRPQRRELLFAEERVALRTGHHEYICWGSGKEEVYDLSVDPAERRDLAGDDAALFPLRTVFDAIEVRASASTSSAEPPPLDERTRAAMRALGYLR